MKTLYRWLAASFIVLMFFSMASSVHAQDVQSITGTHVEYSSGQQLTITADLAEGVEPTEVQVFLRSQGDTYTISGIAVIEPGRVVYTHDLAHQPLKAFTNIEYWFSTTLADGTRQVSQPFSFFYEDNRFAWDTRQEGPFRLHWYEGDAAFVQKVLDVAQTGLQSAQNYFSYPPLDQGIDIYVYASGVDLNSLSQFYGPTMVIGHADPPLSLMTVLIPPGPGDTMAARKVVSHELVHILLYRKVGPRYSNLPEWLNEGLASLNEGSSDPDFYTILDEAVKKNTLIPMPQLCDRFPLDGNNYILSYVQSYYFVRYLYQTYGATKLEELISQYADGIGCEIAPQAVLGSDLVQLDKSWRAQEFGYNTKIEVMAPLIPWLVVAGVVLFAPGILFLFSALRSAPQKR